MSHFIRICAVSIAVCFALVVQAQDFETVKSTAENGDVYAQYNLGVMYAEGRGVAQNEVEAAKWYHMAAKQKHPLAQKKLEDMKKSAQTPKKTDNPSAMQ